MTTTIKGENLDDKMVCTCGCDKFVKFADKVVYLYKKGDTVIRMTCFPDRPFISSQYFCLDCRKEIKID